MSDPDDASDPVDAAYGRSEALIADEAARAARRERVLAAVSRAPEAPTVRVSSSGWRAWRRGGWLAAACVAGASLFLAVQVYRLLQPRLPSPAPPPIPAAAASAGAAPPAATAAPPGTAPS